MQTYFDLSSSFISFTLSFLSSLFLVKYTPKKIPIAITITDKVIMIIPTFEVKKEMNLFGILLEIFCSLNFYIVRLLELVRIILLFEGF